MASYLVIGASRGLGYEFIRQLSQNKANTVIGIARNKTATDEKLAKDGIEGVTIYQADIVDALALQKAAGEAAQLLGSKGLDHLIANAGMMPDTSALLSLKDMEHQPDVLNKDMFDAFNTNVIGVMNVVSAFLPLVKQSQLKKVILISTAMGDLKFLSDNDIYVGVPYAASRAALNIVNLKYHLAYVSEGLLFVAISPGFVATNEVDPSSLPPEMIAGFTNMIDGFKKYKPDFAGQILPHESVERVLGLVEKATVQEFGGKFISHFGNEQWL